MRVKHITTAVSAVALGACAMALHANENNTGHNWMPKQPQNMYWQAPNYSFPPSFNTAPPSYNPPPVQQNTQNNTYQPPVAQQRPPAYRPPQRPAYNNPPPNYNRPNNQGNYQPNMNRPAPNAQFNSNRNNRPPQGPYNSGNYRRDNGASAYNIPGYRRNQNNNNWNNNKFWGQSGPSRWMNPNKGNMEQGWDDMINAPSRMGEMPGGWTAPEVSMPNPIDMGDQMQDNVKDLPEQIRNMDVGN